LNHLGWSVLVIWECELKCIEEVAAKITQFLCGIPSRNADTPRRESQ
jgi:G:T-mismatch repair DNA endonuclease (very short patch repair protein)